MTHKLFDKKGKLFLVLEVFPCFRHGAFACRGPAVLVREFDGSVERGGRSTKWRWRGRQKLGSWEPSSSSRARSMSSRRPRPNQSAVPPPERRPDASLQADSMRADAMSWLLNELRWAGRTRGEAREGEGRDGDQDWFRDSRVCKTQTRRLPCAEKMSRFGRRISGGILGQCRGISVRQEGCGRMGDQLKSTRRQLAKSCVHVQPELSHRRPSNDPDCLVPERRP